MLCHAHCLPPFEAMWGSKLQTLHAHQLEGQSVQQTIQGKHLGLPIPTAPPLSHHTLPGWHCLGFPQHFKCQVSVSEAFLAWELEIKG